MGAEPAQNWQAIVATTLDWWRDAGVDVLVGDEPRDWLARPTARTEPATTEPDVAAQPVETLPDTIEDFVAWRRGADAPEAGWMAPLLGPTGPSGAEWTLLVEMPEPDDDNGLLSGEAGMLLNRMLAAIGQSRESVMVLPLAYARPITGRIPPEQWDRLAHLTRHHLSLIRPRKLLLFGEAASRVLGGTSGWPPDNRLHEINQFHAKSDVVTTCSLHFMLQQPAAKSEAWKHLLLLTRGSE